MINNNADNCKSLSNTSSFVYGSSIICECSLSTAGISSRVIIFLPFRKSNTLNLVVLSEKVSIDSIRSSERHYRSPFPNGSHGRERDRQLHNHYTSVSRVFHNTTGYMVHQKIQPQVSIHRQLPSSRNVDGSLRYELTMPYEWRRGTLSWFTNVLPSMVEDFKS